MVRLGDFWRVTTNSFILPTGFPYDPLARQPVAVVRLFRGLPTGLWRLSADPGIFLPNTSFCYGWLLRIGKKAGSSNDPFLFFYIVGDFALASSICFEHRTYLDSPVGVGG